MTARAAIVDRKFCSLLCSVAAGTLWVVPTSAQAQVQSAPQPPVAEPGPGPDATSPADKANVGDIVITAQRRTENLQRSSLSIGVVSAQELQRAALTDARDLNRIVPNVQIGTSAGFTQTFVRGIGSSSANQFGDPSVTFNEDGVVIDRPNAVGPLFYDLARVEVLRGPQGTLYGRNATGGAINVITQAPTRDVGGFASAQYGSYNEYILTGALNAPASDTLAFRFSGQLHGRDSYLKGGYPSGGYPDTRSQAGRVQALWKPTDRTSLRLIAEASHDTGQGDNFVLIAPNETDGGDWLGAANAEANAVIHSLAPNQILIRSDDDRLKRDLWNVTAELNHDLGFATLTVLPAYRHLKMANIAYDGGIRLNYRETSKQSSIETRLANSKGRFKWLIGGFYFDNDRNVFNEIDSNPISQRSRQVFPKIGSKSYAVFADSTFSISDTLRVLGGIRYTHEVKTVQGVRTDLDANPTNNFVLNNRRVFKQVTWRAGGEWDLAPNSMAYATVATGFKSGGFYTAVSPGNQFDPEHLTAYTLGVRNRFLDNKVQLNIEGFYWKYKDNQQSHIGFDDFGNIAFVTNNAGDARLWGVSADLVARPTVDDTIGLNAEYNNTKFNSFTYQVPSFFNGASTGCSLGPVVAGRRTVDCSGFPLPRAPRLTGRASYEHAFRFVDGSDVRLAFTGVYSSSKYLTIDYLPIGRQGKVFTGDIDATFNPRGGRYSLTAFVHNVTNQIVYTGGSEHQQIAGVFYANVNPPRTFGIRGQVNF